MKANTLQRLVQADARTISNRRLGRFTLKVSRVGADKGCAQITGALAIENRGVLKSVHRDLMRVTVKCSTISRFLGNFPS